MMPLAGLADRAAPLPASFGQRRLWFFDQLVPGSCAYVVMECFWLGDGLDAGALRRALGLVICRHEVLRTVFSTVDGEPVQVVLPPGQAGDVLEVAQDAQDAAAAERVMARRLRQPFDLQAGPLVRALLVRCGQGSGAGWLLGLAVHHIVFDEWSLGIVLGELSQCYAAAVEGRDPALAELPADYADYAVWQRSQQPTGWEEQLSYWLDRLGGAPATLGLPCDRARPPVQSFSGGLVTVTLGGNVPDTAKKVAQEHNATLFMVLLTAFNVLLARYCGHGDVVIGVPVAGRARVELEQVVGFFVNTLALRTDLSGSPTFAEALRRVRDTAVGAFARQDLPFDNLVEHLAPQRDLSHNPVFQVMFALQNAPVQPLALPGVPTRSHRLHTGTALFDLSLHITETSGQLQAAFEYDAALFDHATIEAMAGHYTQLCRAAVAAPGTPIHALPMLTPEASRQLLRQAGGPPARTGSFLHDLIAARATATPQATAIVHNGATMTYQQLEQHATRLASHLRALGAAPDTPIAICLRRGPHLITALYAVLKAGAACLPLDPGHPAQRTSHILSHVQPLIIITQPDLDLPRHHPPVAVYLTPSHDITTARAAAICCPATRHQPHPSNLAYLIHTSGTTGTPKGVMITHVALANHARYFTRACELSRADRVLQLASAAFDTMAEEVWPILIAGGTLVLGDSAILTFHQLEEVCISADVTVLDLPTAYWTRWVTELGRGSGQVPPTLRLIVVGGEQLTRSAVQAWMSVAPGTPVTNSYGPTETTVISALALDVGPEDGQDPPLGSAIAGTRLLVLDPELRLQPPGVPGELCIAGTGTARGYHNQPAATAERFLPNPYGPPGSTLYRTGDRVRLDTRGHLRYLGRLDRQLKIRGHRVEPAEIEAILRAHSAVDDALVTTVQVPAAGPLLAAYLVGQLTVDDLPAVLDHVRVLLPEYMAPARFAILCRFPLTANGKIDHRSLPGTIALTADEHESPRGPIEERLTVLIGDLLDVPGIGRQDNFFRLGGHSLLAAQLVARIAATFDVDIPLCTVFAYPHVAGLSAAISAAQPGQGRPAGLPQVPSS